MKQIKNVIIMKMNIYINNKISNINIKNYDK